MRSYNSMKESYRRGSRSPGGRSPLSRSPLQYSRPGSRDRLPAHHSPVSARGSGGLRPRSRSPRIYRSPQPSFDRKSPDFRRDGSPRDYSPRSGGRDRFAARYSRERSRSPRDYDRNSLQSSGSRRHFSPRYLIFKVIRKGEDILTKLYWHRKFLTRYRLIIIKFCYCDFLC